MKRLIVILLFIPVFAIGQTFTVTFVKGVVYYNKVLLKIGDNVSGNNTLSSSDPKAVVALVNAKVGKKYISFASAASGNEKKGVAAYELVIDKFLNQFPDNVLTTRDAQFDLHSFFADTTNDPENNLLLINGQKLPRLSVTSKIYADDEFYICYEQSGDCEHLISSKDSLSVTLLKAPKTAGPITCRVEVRYQSNGETRVRKFPIALQVTLLDKNEFERMISILYADLHSYYEGDQRKIESAIDDHIHQCYGKFFEPEITGTLSRIKKIN